MSDSAVDRREFAKRLAIGVIGGAVCEEVADAAQEGQTTTHEQATTSAEHHLLRVIQIDHPEAVPPEAEAEVLGQIRRFRSVSAALARFPLTNADAPMPGFQPYRADD